MRNFLKDIDILINPRFILKAIPLALRFTEFFCLKGTTMSTSQTQSANTLVTLAERASLACAKWINKSCDVFDCDKTTCTVKGSEYFNETHKSAKHESLHNLWGGGQCAVIEYAKKWIAQAPNEEIPLNDDCKKYLDRLCNLTHNAHVKHADTILGFPDVGIKGKDLPHAVEQSAHLVRGICHTVRAAIHLALWSPQRNGGNNEEVKNNLTHASDDLQVAAVCYAAAWPLGDRTVSSIVNAAHRQNRSERSIAVLDQLIIDRKIEISTSTWLILQRLLAYLFGEVSSKNELLNQVHVPLAVAHGGQTVGSVLPVDVVLQQVGHSGICLDPVAFGITTFDVEMLESLTLAAGLAKQAFDEHRRDNNLEHPFSVRVDPVPNSFLRLEGASAGGLFAAGLVATALGHRLNRDVTASFRLCFGEPVSGNQITANQVNITPVNEGSIEAKLKAAKEDGLNTVFLAPTQKIGISTQIWARGDIEPKRPCDVTVRPATTLYDVIHGMTGDERIEKVLKDYCEHVHTKWHGAQPTPFIPPRIGRLPDKNSPVDSEEMRRERTDGKEIEREDRYLPLVDDEHAPPEAQLSALLGLGTRICVTEDAGAGKTIFTHQVLHYLATPEGCAHHDNRPGLPVRFESRMREWPADVLAALIKALNDSNALQKTGGPTADEVVDYALKNGRVTLILDAFDQVHESKQEVVEKIWEFLNQHMSGPDSPDASSGGDDVHQSDLRPDLSQQNRAIVTSRAFAVRAASSVTYFPRERWRFATIFGFNREEQTKYLREANLLTQSEDVADLFAPPAGSNDENLYEADEDVQKLLSVPVILSLLKELSREEIRKIRVRGDLYQKAHEKLTLRAGMIPNVKFNNRKCTAILSASAFQMMLNGVWNYSLTGSDSVATLQDDVQSRCSKHGTVVNDVDDVDDWQQLMTWAELTDHAVLDDVSNTSRHTLSWKHRGWMEYFCGLYLARYLQPKDAEEALVHNGEENWYWAWRFAIEMPATAINDECRYRALELLFQPVPEVKDQQGKVIPRLRPTELMFRAWVSLQDQRPDQNIIERFQNQFYRLLVSRDKKGPTEDAKLAATLIPQDELQGDEKQGLVERGRKSRLCETDDEQEKVWLQVLNVKSWVDQIAPPPNEPAYVRCPPGDEPYHRFWMGSDEKYRFAKKNEKPRHEVEVPAFLIAPCTVTRAQYRLFDSQFERRYAGDLERISPDDDCPVIMTAWYDALIFSLFVGGSLPTETEWECAARAGRDEPNDIIGVPPYDHTFTTEHVNYDGGDPLDGVKKSPCFGRTLPVRWDETRRSAYAQSTLENDKLPPMYTPNAWGLWHCHGNVWEWCLSAYDDDLYNQRAEKQEPIPESREDATQAGVSVDRVLRGGSWHFLAEVCRSADRGGFHPTDRYVYDGFRLSWRCAAVASESSSAVPEL